MRDLITSTANPQIKHIRSLFRSRKQRNNERVFVAEGVRLVGEVIHAGLTELVIVVPEQLETTPRGRDLLAQVLALPHTYPTTPQIMATLSDVENPQGIIAVAKRPQLHLPPITLGLVLDSVQDPGNVGTLIRSAEAAGVDAVVCLPGTADVWNPKVVRAGMGTHLRVPLLQAESFAHAKLLLDSAPWYAADQQGTQRYDQVDWCAPSVLVVGNEANGISADLHDHCQLVAIPMHGAVESLNAAIAGSVVLFEAARQRRIQMG